MTITEAIARLKAVAATHGGDVQVYFDCPKCGASTAPTWIATIAERTKAVLVKEADP